MLPVALHAFHLARQRYLRGLRAGLPEEQLVIAAMEVTYWACALDEQLKNRDAWYRGCREYGRAVMQGVRYARNQATHQLPMLVQRRAGFQAPIVAPFRADEIVWTPLDQLPPPDRTPSREQRDNYHRHLSGRPVRHTIDAVAAWFAAEQNRSGSLIEVSSRPSRTEG
ncbi:hypothetical protein ADK77_08270 [Streptomyces antibioticus]|nr:hypothetical protein ADK77_08270 [Streptomyces antibioticus]